MIYYVLNEPLFLLLKIFFKLFAVRFLLSVGFRCYHIDKLLLLLLGSLLDKHVVTSLSLCHRVFALDVLSPPLLVDDVA